MVIVSICIVACGILLDVVDFISRTTAFLKREKVESAVPLFGFILVAVGLVGLRIFSDWMSTQKLILFIILAFIFELFMQMIMPVIFTMGCNLYYGRKLFDMSTLPSIKEK